MITIFSTSPSRVEHRKKRRKAFIERRRRWERGRLNENIWNKRHCGVFSVYGKVKETIVTIYHSTIRLIIILMLLCVYVYTQSTFFSFSSRLLMLCLSIFALLAAAEWKMKSITEQAESEKWKNLKNGKVYVWSEWKSQRT
jgi:hypothetical protein